MFCLTNEPKSQGSRPSLLSFANPMDDMAALNESLTAVRSGNLIGCSSCVEELKRNKCIGYIVPKKMRETLISLDVAVYILIAYRVSTTDIFHFPFSFLILTLQIFIIERMLHYFPTPQNLGKRGRPHHQRVLFMRALKKNNTAKIRIKRVKTSRHLDH